MGAVEGIAGPTNFAARYLGFPYEVRRRRGTPDRPSRCQLRASPGSLWKTLAVAALAMARTVAFHLSFLFSTGEAFKTSDFEGAGITSQDVLVIGLHDFLGVTAIVALAAVARRPSAAAAVAAAADRLGEATTRADGRRTRRKMRRVVLAWGVLTSVTVASYFGATYQSGFLLREPLLRWMLIVLDPLGSFFGISNPWLVAMTLLVTYLIGVLAENFDDMQARFASNRLLFDAPDEMRAAPNDGQGNAGDDGRKSSSSVRKLVDRGLELCELVDAVNSALGTFLIVCLSTLVVQLCTLLYLNAGLVLEGKLMLVFLVVAYAARAAVLCVLICQGYSAGQSVEDSMAAAGAAAREAMRMTRGEDGRLRLLVKRLGSPDRTISPKGFFSLNLSGMLSAAAMMTTYMIVLLQFRKPSRGNTGSAFSVLENDEG